MPQYATDIMCFFGGQRLPGDGLNRLLLLVLQNVRLLSVKIAVGTIDLGWLANRTFISDRRLLVLM